MCRSVLPVAFLLNGELHRVAYNLVGEGKVPHILDILNIMELHSFEIDGWNLVYVFLVVLTHYYISDACALGSKNLFLYAAYRKHFAAERYLACHRRVLAHLALCERRGY